MITIPVKERPVKIAGMDDFRYAFAQQYFISNGLVFSHNGGKSFGKVVHILRCQCASWAEFACGNHKINTITNILSWREQEVAQRELDTLWQTYGWKEPLCKSS